MTERLSDDELTALLAAHRKFYADCNVCRVAWPCETVRLATEVRDLRAVRDAAQDVRDSPIMLGGMRWGRTEYTKRMAALDEALGHYEEGRIHE